MAESRINNGAALRRGFGLVVVLMGWIGVWTLLDEFAFVVVAPSRPDPDKGRGKQQQTKATPTKSSSGNTVQVPATATREQPLSFLYQDRLNRMEWLKSQCEFCQSIIQPNQTVFPYLEVPPLPEERAEQFDVPLKARIAVLHVWSSDESLTAAILSVLAGIGHGQCSHCRFLHLCPR